MSDGTGPRAWWSLGTRKSHGKWSPPCWLSAALGTFIFALSNHSWASDPLILRSTTPAQRWLGSVTPELMFGDDMLPDWVVNSRLLNSLIPKVSYGLNDRDQIGVFPLGVARRLGDANATELIPAFSLNPFISHSPSSGATIAVNPLLAIDARQWIKPGSNVTLGGGISPRVAYLEGCTGGDDCRGRLEALTNWFFAAQGGVVQTFGPVTVALGATVQYTFSTAQAGQETAALTFGSRVRHGLLSDPTIRVHLSDTASIDVHIEYTRTLNRGTGVAVASLGANVFF